MARAFPNSRFTATTSPRRLALARRGRRTGGLTNARFLLQDAARLDTPAAYDFITAFDTIHDQADPAAVLHTSPAPCAPAAPS
jgi:hypothetical protein